MRTLVLISLPKETFKGCKLKRRPSTTVQAATEKTTLLITRPHHPFRGREATIIEDTVAKNGELIVQLEDGMHIAIDAISTNYYGDPPKSKRGKNEVYLRASDLLDIARLIQALRQKLDQ